MKKIFCAFLFVSLLFCSALAEDVEFTIEYVTPPPAPVTVYTYLDAMSLDELVSLQNDLESRIEELRRLEESSDPSNTGMWELTYYVDEFGLPTDTKYIRNAEYISGTFSNTATNNSDLNVRLLIDEDDVSIMLYEYSRSQVKNSYSKGTEYRVSVLDSSGERHILTGRMYSDRISFYPTDTNTLLGVLKAGGTIRFSIVESDRTTTKYNFVIEDCSYFSNAYDLLFE